jgi:hypothetical protein
MSIFSNLIASFPTWDSLKSHLTEANLTLTDDGRYVLLSYNEASNKALPYTHAFRSVVWDTVRHLPVGVTPFQTTEGPVPCDFTAIEPMVDGVPIGVFWDQDRNEWRLFTRKVLDAGNRFYSQTKTFATMAEEAGLWTLLPLEPETPFTSYTFMLQHPENRVVVPVTTPHLVCVQVAVTQADGSIVYQSPATMGGVRTLTPAEVGFSPSEITRGFIFKNTTTGQQWAIENPLYTAIRGLRGDSSRLDFHWMTLYAQKRLEQYLAFYPEERVAAVAFISEWKALGQELFSLYGDIYFRRTARMDSIPAKFKARVASLGTNVFFGLHNAYNAHRQVSGERLTRDFVQFYLDGLDLPLRIHILNWGLRTAAQATGKSFVPSNRPAHVVGPSIYA